jgi:signal transduction histidine kinase
MIPALGWPARWWARQSLRARLTLIATALFSFAVLTGAVLLLVLQRYALVNVLDSTAEKTGRDIASQMKRSPTLQTVLPTTGGVAAVQVVNGYDVVVAASPGTNRTTPLVNRNQLRQIRDGARLNIPSTTSDAQWRVLGVRVDDRTVLVVTDLARVDDSLRVLTRAALIGGPLAVLLMALASYGVAALTLRPVAELRRSAADITAAGLADQRLPVPGAQDEIHRLAVTLNAMLDRIDAATTRQRTFVGDAAHELRSPLASLRVQLEVAQRLGPDTDWSELLSDVLIDVDRLDNLVEDLLALARMDEAGGGLRRHELLDLEDLVRAVTAGYHQARVPVRYAGGPPPAATPALPGGPPIAVEGDPEALRRVVVNLTDNAVRYARSEVVVAIEPVGGAVRPAGRPTVTLTVTDDGPGIPPGERERVFDRFYRVEASRSREYGGTGLGLAIVRDLVRAHGGSVRLAARPDGAAGLQAVVVLPAVAGIAT